MFCIALFFISNISAEDSGLFSNFENLLESQKEAINQSLNTFINEDFNLNNIKDIQTVRLSDEYLNLILLNTPYRYLSLARNDKCALYDLMNTNLLNLPGGKVKKVVFTFENTNGKEVNQALSLKDFLRQIAYKQCPSNKKFKSFFTLNNLRSTLKNLKIKAPTSEEACVKDMQNFEKDLKAPFICDLVEEIKNINSYKIQLRNISRVDYTKRSDLELKLSRASSYQKIISNNAYDLLEGKCKNLGDPKLYCEQYFKESLWSQLFYQENQKDRLEFFCPDMNTKNCIKELNSNDSSCFYRNSNFDSLMPLPTCSRISQAISRSRLKYNYNDCPGKTGNESVTSFSRVLNHFTPIPLNNSCEVNSTLPFASFIGEVSEYEQWQISICFNDTLIGNDKVCYPTLLGEANGSNISLSKVLGKIASRLRGFNGEKCSMVPEKEYNPSLLKFKNGCHILIPTQGCYGTHCDFKVMLGDQKFDKFKIVSDLQFELLPIDFVNENKSIIKLFQNNKKMNVKAIKNMSSFLRNYKNHKSAVFLGMGCAEELLPSYFKRFQLNQCTALPFIADGYIESEGAYSLTIRSSFDSIQIPRVISWSLISESIKAYMNLHPTSAWGFYAIY